MPIPLVIAAVSPTVWALVAGAGAEAAYAWYDPDLFTKGIWSNYELDKRVEVLNNYWVHLERILNGRIDPGSAVAKDMRAYVAGWVGFKRRYDDAIFRRAIDPFGLWGAKADYEAELNEIWVPRFNETLTKAITHDPLISDRMKAKGVDVEVYMQRSGLNQDGTSKGSNTGLYVGIGITVLLIGIGAVLAAKPTRRARIVY